MATTFEIIQWAHLGANVVTMVLMAIMILWKGRFTKPASTFNFMALFAFSAINVAGLLGQATYARPSDPMNELFYGRWVGYAVAHLLLFLAISAYMFFHIWTAFSFSLLRVGFCVSMVLCLLSDTLTSRWAWFGFGVTLWIIDLIILWMFSKGACSFLHKVYLSVVHSLPAIWVIIYEITGWVSPDTAAIIYAATDVLLLANVWMLCLEWWCCDNCIFFYQCDKKKCDEEELLHRA